MMTEKGIFSDLVRTYKSGNMTVKLIFINLLCFVAIGLFEVLGRNISSTFYTVMYYVVGLCTNFNEFIFRPWGIFTYMFAHFGFFHLLMNMLFLYVVGQYFEQFFSAKRMFYTYLLGGLFGGLFELVIHLIMPTMSGSYVIGASGSVMAVMTAIAFYQPQLTVSIWGLFNVRLIYIAMLFLFSNMYSVAMGADTGTAHLAHLGGMFLGYLSVKNPFSSTNIVNRGMAIGDKLVGFFKHDRVQKGSFSYSKNRASQSVRNQSDEEYNYEKKLRQEKIDAILDKISKSGYESLTKEEKELLFSQSNKR
ncbi:MAG TPA: rhomboid family intramembrane serine protease [Taishania sp.]|nr:rhomboid family intramembrane serine protease [Taishania sp.]